jgi:hypothetical protein
MHLSQIAKGLLMEWCGLKASRIVRMVHVVPTLSQSPDLAELLERQEGDIIIDEISGLRSNL